MSLRLNEKDIKLLKFLALYKNIKGVDCKKIYKSKGYHYKRLKALEKERYIKRKDKYYLTLDTNGRDRMRDLGYFEREECRSPVYKERISEIKRVAEMTLDSSIEFEPSWRIKDARIYTITSKKYIGTMIFQDKEYYVYFISNDKDFRYIKQVLSDIKQLVSKKNIIVFVENMKIVNKSRKYFMQNIDSTLIINPTKTNFERMKLLQNIDLYDIAKKIYNGKEILFSDWEKANYMTENFEYIVFMPFIDTECLRRLNTFFNSNSRDKIFDIITFSENIEKVNEILNENVNIIELDSFLGGTNEEY